MLPEQRIIKPIKIIADDREANSHTVLELQNMPGVEIMIQRLPLGDYEIDKSFLFERKTLIDLTASIKDGRLFKQACQLASSPMRNAIILEGTSKDLVDSKMRREAIQGALITLTIVLGIPILRSKDPQETARLMLYAAKQFKTIQLRAVRRQVKRPKGKRKIQLHFLQGLPGIGPERAQRMLDKFCSVEGVITAGLQELMDIPGIGIRLAKKIRWVVS